MKGSLVRARVQWLSEGKKPSKYFCSLEWCNYVETTIKRVVKPSGKICIEQKEILSELKDFIKTYSKIMMIL